MRTRLWALALSGIIGHASGAQNVPAFPPELLGTWATAEIDCRRPGPTTLTITPTTVLRDKVSGDISGGRLIGRKSVQVDFEYFGPDYRNLGTRIFRLSADSRSLFELSGGAVVATRHKCAAAEKQPVATGTP